MLLHPFKIFEPYKNILDVHMLTREDAVASDADIKRVLGVQSIASLDQVHGNRCVVVRNASSRMEAADSLATDQKGLTLTIRFADCQNFMVFDPDHAVVCLIHAGWKGVQCEAIRHAFLCMQSEWGTNPKNVLVAAGPSLCCNCADFSDPKKEVPELAAYAEGSFLDLNRAADDQLFSLGVTHDHFERMHDCTRCHPNTYWSYRSGDDDVVVKTKRNCLAATLL